MKKETANLNAPKAAPAVTPPPLPPATAILPAKTSALPVASAGNLNQFPVPSELQLPQSRSSPNLGESAHSTEDQNRKDHWLWAWMFDAPSWLVSTLVHVAVILLLALIPLKDEVQNSLSLILGMSDGSGEGEELTAFDLSDASMEMETSDEIGEDLSMMVTELDPSVTEIPNFDGNLELSSLTLRGGLSSRTGLMKDALLKAYGGTAETERAVALGLEWLKRQQSSDGSWSLAGPYSEGGVNENRPAATAMALLAFMGAGNTHKGGNYQNNVARGLDYLLSIQDDDGYFAAKATGIQRTYSQAQASIAVCELYGMTGDEALRVPAQRSVRWALDAQGDLGGWRYQPRDDGDTSVTGWYVMALISARMAGLDVDSDALERVHQFLDTVQRKPGQRDPNPDGEQYAYLPSGQAKDSMTAEGILCRMYLGWKTTDPRIIRGCDLLAGNPISSELSKRDYYYWYYATNSLHHAGGKAWNRWNAVMREVLPSIQIQTGRERGSWPPQGDPHGDAGGRLYSTVLAILCLEAYYRHMPLSEMAGH
jgi:hypothetical protein